MNFSRECQKLLDLPTHIEPGEARILFDYVGEGYAIPSAECIEAMRLVAKTEAIILDPNYTAKAMAGLVDSIRKGILGAQDTVVFIHTGGTPELFSYAESILRLMATLRRGVGVGILQCFLVIRAGLNHPFPSRTRK